MAAVVRRVESLEAWQRSSLGHGVDGVAASAVAGLMGLPAGVLVQTGLVEQRRALARELRRREWSVARIARVLNCCERTAERWVQLKLKRTE